LGRRLSGSQTGVQAMQKVDNSPWRELKTSGSMCGLLTTLFATVMMRHGSKIVVVVVVVAVVVVVVVVLV
jgi:hypothetical protein